MKDFSKKYLSFLKNELAGINLTRILDPDEFYKKQILDSIEPVNSSLLFRNSIKECEFVVDIGFGGGFPIVPLAKIFPESSFFGFEAREKKVNAVKKIVKHFNLKNISLYHKRVEDIYFDKDVVVTFKAVGRIEKFLKMLNLKEGSKVFFYKGPSLYIDENLKVDGFKLLEVVEVLIPETEKRYIVSFEKVPCGTLVKKINKNLVKFSSLI